MLDLVLAALYAAGAAYTWVRVMEPYPFIRDSRWRFWWAIGAVLCALFWPLAWPSAMLFLYMARDP